MLQMRAHSLMAGEPCSAAQGQQVALGAFQGAHWQLQAVSTSESLLLNTQ